LYSQHLALTVWNILFCKALDSNFTELASGIIRIGVYLFYWFVVKPVGLERRLIKIEEILSLLIDPNKGSITKWYALKY